MHCDRTNLDEKWAILLEWPFFQSCKARGFWLFDCHLANLEWVVSRLQRSIRSCRNALWYPLAKDLIGGGSNMRETEAASFAMSTAVGCFDNGWFWVAIQTLFLFGLASVAGSMLLSCAVIFKGVNTITMGYPTIYLVLPLLQTTRAVVLFSLHQQSVEMTIGWFLRGLIL
jgi:hypothetical protein